MAERPTKIVFVLTGAGISAESGLGTFREPDQTGLWSRLDPSKLATPEAFASDPAAVHAFYNTRRRDAAAAQPNAAHRALAELEAGLTARGDLLALVTQNVDDLHERAGSRQVVHMHGELNKVRCTGCSQVQAWTTDLGTDDICPVCARRGSLRPDIVWFGETPMHLSLITRALEASMLFVAIGTSGSVYPAAGLVSHARALAIPTCEINLAPSDNAEEFDEALYGPASETVPAWVARLLGH